MKTQSLEGLTGMIITPESPEYEEARQEWNRAIQKYPLIIVYCSCKEDVSNAVRWAETQHIGIRIRSGGHHYEGYSVGNGILVIDVSRMKKLQLDSQKGTVKMESGVENHELYELVGREGYPFPGGTCPTVGVTGYTLGGGWGYSSRYLGLGCDSLLELELIDYKGNAITANAQRNPELFWGCRGGGGGNFGVITSMTYKLPPKVARVTLVELGRANVSQEMLVQFLEIWQNWLENLNPGMTINASLYHSSEEGMGIYGRGLYYGPVQEARLLLEPFAKLEGMEFLLQERTFLEAMREIQASYPDYEKFKSTGRFVQRKYNRNELERIAGLIKHRALGSVYAAVTVYAMGGRIKKVDKDATAFYYRNAEYIMGIQSVWEEAEFAEENVRWMGRRFKYVESITKGSYINFPYSCLLNYEQDYYGEHTVRLRKINRAYDPNQVFNFPQAIR